MRLEECDVVQLRQLELDERLGTPLKQRIRRLIAEKSGRKRQTAGEIATRVREVLDARPEWKIRIEIKKWYRLQGAHVWDTEQGRADPRVDAGLADLIVLWPGRRVRFVEVKSAKGRQRPAQMAFQFAAEQAGAVYLMPRSLQTVIEFEAANPS